MDDLDTSRRQVLKGSAAAMAIGAIGSLGALQSRQAEAHGRGRGPRHGDPVQLEPAPSP